MKYWRMALRIGNQGEEMWPDCRERGIAAIGYYTDEGKPVVSDCSKLTIEEFNQIWRETYPRNTTGRSSLRKVAYEMKIGDVIYVKQGPSIVGRGTVTSEYKYDPDILEDARIKIAWEHFVKVDWESDFEPIDICLGAEQTTVLELSGERLRRLKAAIATRNRKG